MKSVLSQIISCSDIYPILGNTVQPVVRQEACGLLLQLPASFSSFLPQFPHTDSSIFLSIFPPWTAYLCSATACFFSCLFMLCSLFMKIAWLLPRPENFFLLLIQSSPTFSSFIQVSSYLKGSFNSLHAPYSTVSSFVESHEFRIVGQSTLVE